MKIHKKVIGFSLLFSMLACVNQPFYDVYKSTVNRRWHRHEKPTFQIHVKDTTALYDVWVYIRHTGEYEYANLFFIAHESGPKLQDTFHRHELQLATPDGRWTGQNAGNLYENKLLLKDNYTFPDTGIYSFSIEQNMHENPLLDVTDIGLKIIKK